MNMIRYCFIIVESLDDLLWPNNLKHVLEICLARNSVHYGTMCIMCTVYIEHCMFSCLIHIAILSNVITSAFLLLLQKSNHVESRSSRENVTLCLHSLPFHQWPHSADASERAGESRELPTLPAQHNLRPHFSLRAHGRCHVDEHSP